MKTSVSIGIFLVVALVVWWSITGDYGKNRPGQAKEDRHYIELFMNQFEMTTMDDNGKPAYRLNGERLQRYNDSNVAQIEKPVFYLLESGKKWKISADSAQVNSRKNTVMLKDNVVMQQQDKQPALNIRTKELLIYTKKQLARTSALVDIDYGQSHLKSKGMIYNNISSELRLNAQVSGYYLPYD